VATPTSSPTDTPSDEDDSDSSDSPPDSDGETETEQTDSETDTEPAESEDGDSEILPDVVVDGEEVPSDPGAAFEDDEETGDDESAQNEDSEQSQESAGGPYDWTITIGIVDGEETTVALVGTDGNGSAEMALIDRNNDGRVESTEKQFETLYPNLDWDVWNSIVN
jgi:hypothetical protein